MASSMCSTYSEVPLVSHHSRDPLGLNKFLTTSSCCRVIDYSTVDLWKENEECHRKKLNTYTVHEGLNIRFSESAGGRLIDFVLF